jgi:hypothetical protein
MAACWLAAARASAALAAARPVTALLRELPARIEHRPPLRQRTDGAARTTGGRAAEMPSDTENSDSDGPATVYVEPLYYRTRRERHASLSPDLGETAATARYRERLWSGEMGRRYFRLRAAEKKKKMRQELEARVAAFAEREATATTTAASVSRAVSGGVGAGADAVQDAFSAIWRGYTEQHRFVLTCMVLVLGSAVIYLCDIKAFWLRASAGGLGLDTESRQGKCAETEPPSVGSCLHRSCLHRSCLQCSGLTATCCAPCVPRVCCVRSRGAR